MTPGTGDPESGGDELDGAKDSQHKDKSAPKHPSAGGGTKVGDNIPDGGGGPDPARGENG